MDPPEYEWFYDADEEAIISTTATVVHTYFYLSHMYGVEKPDTLLVPVVILEASPTQPLAP